MQNKWMLLDTLSPQIHTRVTSSLLSSPTFVPPHSAPDIPHRLPVRWSSLHSSRASHSAAGRCRLQWLALLSKSNLRGSPALSKCKPTFLIKLPPRVTVKRNYLLILKSFLNFPKSLPVHTKSSLPFHPPASPCPLSVEPPTPPSRSLPHRTASLPSNAIVTSAPNTSKNLLMECHYILLCVIVISAF